MHPKQAKEIVQNARARMRFEMMGELPPLVRPKSPLIDLLESISPRHRVQIRGIQISKLGYCIGHRFANAAQLLNWLKPADQMLARRSWPAESYRDKRFRKTLTLQDLKANATHWPDNLLIN